MVWCGVGVGEGGDLNALLFRLGDGGLELLFYVVAPVQLLALAWFQFLTSFVGLEGDGTLSL